VKVAIDFRTIPYYGAEQPSLVSDSRLLGTTRGIKFATLSVVEAGKTFTLRTKQVGPFTSKVKVVSEMLDFLRGLIEPSIVLMDRGFYSVDVIKALKSAKKHFLMLAERTSSIKRLVEAFERGKLPSVIDYTVRSSSGDAVDIRLLFVRKKTEDGLRTFVFVSDLPLDPEAAVEVYSCRWRIETNNRELKKFMARTTSTDMKIRRIYYSLAALLYNLWIVMRVVLGELRSHGFKKILDVLLSVVAQQSPFGGPGPPV